MAQVERGGEVSEGQITREELLEIVERTLAEALPAEGARPSDLSDSVRYAVGAGGKRIRPLICLASAVAVGGRAEDAAYPAAAIELLHNYTLVHDDLPSMDNDATRRGKPSVWAKFGEANAVLAGDALQALAFSTAARAPRNAAGVVAELGRAAYGVVAGQVEDIAATGDTDFIYEHKTADLFVAAAAMGGLAGGGSEADVERLRTFALNLGLAFQFEDDLLDGDSPYGREKTEALVREKTEAAVSALSGLPGDTSFLARLAEKLVSRRA